VSIPAHEVLEAARAQAGMSFDQLWIAYYALGGWAPPEVVRAFLGGSSAAVIDYDVLAQAINERFLDQGGDHPVPYREDLAPPSAPGGGG
jgi:hypothetical protein